MNYGLFDSTVEKFVLYLHSYFSSYHNTIAKNISNSSTPVFREANMENNIDFSTFAQMIANKQKIDDPRLKLTNSDTKPNGNNVDENVQHRMMVNNESKMRFIQSSLQKMIELKEIAAGIKNY